MCLHSGTSKQHSSTWCLCHVSALPQQEQHIKDHDSTLFHLHKTINTHTCIRNRGGYWTVVSNEGILQPETWICNFKYWYNLLCYQEPASSTPAPGASAWCLSVCLSCRNTNRLNRSPIWNWWKCQKYIMTRNGMIHPTT